MTISGCLPFNGSDPVYGVGAKWNVNENLALELDYEKFDIDLADAGMGNSSATTVSVVFQF